MHFDHIEKNEKISQEIKKAVVSLFEMLESRKYYDVDCELISIVLKMINEISEKSLDPRDADDVCTFIYVQITDEFKSAPINPAIADLLIEGMTLHHLNDGTGYGPDLTEMKKYAEGLERDR